MKKITCCFDITNEYIKKNIKCYVNLVEDNNVNYIFFNNEKQSNIEFNNVNLCNGYLKEDNIPIPNASIYFLSSSQSQNVEKISDGINGIKNAERNNTFNMHSNNIIVDKCKTDDNGKYTSFIENGIYDIKIDCGNYKDIQKNILVDDGIEGEYYCIINSLINKKIGKSTYKMNNTEKRMINLSLLNENKTYSNGDLIITQNNKLIVYKKINKNTMFALDNGIYNIRLRNKNTNIKIINNFEFNENDDFVEKLIDEFLMNNNLNLEVN